MPKTDYYILVQVERGVWWVLKQYRSPAARALVNKARSAAARLLAPPDTTSRSVAVGEPVSPAGQPSGSHDALARMSAHVALRDLNLVDSLLAHLEDMEANETDPDALARLYQLDHLAARLRRNAENLRVLAGREAGSTPGAAWPVVDVVRAAISHIEHYRRIDIAPAAALAVVDLVADDLARLLAELLDNATAYSPPMSKVTVSAQLSAQGSMLIRIEDAGDRLPVDQLEALNAQLSATNPGSGSIEQMGLAVVRQLAGKHGIRVSLGSRATRGTTATVLLPPNLVCEAPATPWFADTPMTRLPRPAPAPVGAPADPPGALVPPARGPEPTERGKPHATPGTTRNGLPRRIPQSLREFGAFPSSVPNPRDDPDADHRDENPGERRERLVADLGDFADGEQAARQERPAGSQKRPPE